MSITLNGKSINLEQDQSVTDIVERLHLNSPDQALAVKINGTLLDIDTAVQLGDDLELIAFESPLGKEIFWHTSAHVLAQAVLRLWPEAKPTIGPAIENGFYYDFANLSITDADFETIEKEVNTILNENHSPKRYLFQDKEEAKTRFQHNPFKLELIDGFEEGPITAYEQGEFFDLCRGPHIARIGKIKAFKILKTSGAYWRGDATKPMLTRIYGISFPHRQLLKEYLYLLEEAKKRDHKVLGPKLGLFSLKEEAPGIPFIYPKGMIIWNRLVDFLRDLMLGSGYDEIKTPQLMNQELWERSGHWAHYRQNMYAFEIEEKAFALKPMNCPGCMLYFGSHTRSYRDLPMRIAEFGHVHRHEFSGALSGLFRVRGFHQDDAHLFMKPSDIKFEISGILQLIETIYSTFGLDYRLELSTRPKDSIGTDEDWETATCGLKEALEDWGQPFRINEGDGAFYGPKIDIHIKDALGRSWQCGTVQLDMALPEKFDLTYVDKDGLAKRPVMLHRAIFGSVERFFGILIEHFVGKFPLWISPLPIRIMTVADRHLDAALSMQKKITESGFICDIDDSSESMNKKVRNAQLLQINYMITIGDKEMENKTLSLRTRDNVLHGEMSLDLFLKQIHEEKLSKSLTSSFTV
ncbi:MAG: threonine--tRNA ligase [Candidatus Rhabdochlamydia sp.]